MGVAEAAADGGPPSWTKLLTLVVCSSPVPSNPDTSVLRAVFASFRIVSGLPACAKVLQLDGVQPQLPPRRKRAYDEFEARARALVSNDADFARTAVHRSERFLFAAHNLAAAVGRVNTRFLLSLQHDYVLAKPFDARGLLATMVNLHTRVKHVRLNLRPNVARGFDSVVENVTMAGQLVPLARTRTTHGALPHRAPPTRCTADRERHVWHRHGRAVGRTRRTWRARSTTSRS